MQNNKTILLIFLTLFILVGCTTTTNTVDTQQNEPKLEPIETITTTSDSTVYSSPNVDSKLDEEVKTNESVDVYEKIENDDAVWYQIGDNKWIKEDKVISLPIANNWEEMTHAMLDGYWIIHKIDDNHTSESVSLCKTATVNFDEDSDMLYCGSKEFTQQHDKGIIFVSYNEKSNSFNDYGNSYEIENDDVLNKKAHFNSRDCNGLVCDLLLDYSNFEEGNMTSHSDCIAADNDPWSVKRYFYYYPSFEEAKQAFDNYVVGNIEIIAKVINVRSNYGLQPTQLVDGKWIDGGYYEKIGEVIKGEKYPVHEVVYDVWSEYTWYRIGKEQWIADDGTWLTYTPNE